MQQSNEHGYSSRANSLRECARRRPGYNAQATDRYGLVDSPAWLADCARFVTAHGVDVDKLFWDRWRLDQAAEAFRVFDTQSARKGVSVT